MSSPPYLYGLLRMDVSLEADRHNDAWLGPDTLGIEVTSDSLGARCGLGNSDPQHQVGGKSSAIEDALTFPLPKVGSKLVTIRSDKDSLGAMAVLTLRAQGKGDRIDKLLVSWIGALDRLGYEKARDQNPDVADEFQMQKTVVLNNICLNSKLWANLAEQVMLVSRVLSGEMPEQEYLSVRMRVKKAPMDFTAVMKGDVALVEVHGRFDNARDWANRRHNVALICDDRHESHGGIIKKMSVIRQPSCFDRQAFEAAINVAEAKARRLTLGELKVAGLTWGGPPNIISSPAGRGRESVLQKEVVLTLANEHYRSGIVS